MTEAKPLNIEKITIIRRNDGLSSITFYTFAEGREEYAGFFTLGDDEIAKVMDAITTARMYSIEKDIEAQIVKLQVELAAVKKEIRARTDCPVSDNPI